MTSQTQIVLTVEPSVLADIADTLGNDLNLSCFDLEATTKVIQQHLETYFEDYLENLAIDPVKMLPDRLLEQVKDTAEPDLELEIAA